MPPRFGSHGGIVECACFYDEFCSIQKEAPVLLLLHTTTILTVHFRETLIESTHVNILPSKLCNRQPVRKYDIHCFVISQQSRERAEFASTATLPIVLLNSDAVMLSDWLDGVNDGECIPDKRQSGTNDQKRHRGAHYYQCCVAVLIQKGCSGQ
jgi:hypothetical protein